VGEAGFLDAIAWNEAGLAPAIVQDARSGEVLMLAWVSRESLARTLESGEAVYFSRSRGTLWHKGETSGHFQKIREIRLDCDGDALLFKVEQVGGIACHTGRRRCFFNRLEDGSWSITEGEGEGRPGEPPLLRKGDRENG
jgi:phosphoribosyl-AMP cyclohydrolase